MGGTTPGVGRHVYERWMNPGDAPAWECRWCGEDATGWRHERPTGTMITEAMAEAARKRVVIRRAEARRVSRADRLEARSVTFTRLELALILGSVALIALTIGVAAGARGYWS